MRNTRSLRRLLALGAVAASFVPGAAHATPTGGVYEGGGYAVATGTLVAACASTAQWVPDSGTASVSPIGVSTTSIGIGTSVCQGTRQPATGVVVEVFSKTARIAAATCPGATSCSVDIPPGHGEVHVMTSSFWRLPTGGIWTIVSPVNNDGYCNYSVYPTEIVCRAWATGIS